MAGFAYYVNNDSIFYMFGGMKGDYSKMLGAVRKLFLVSWDRDFNPQTATAFIYKDSLHDNRKDLLDMQ